MYKTDFFIKGYKPLNVLSERESNMLLERIYNGDLKARDEMIEHNISLVFYEVMGRFKAAEYDKSELISSGLVGLIKAVDTFDINKNFKFSTYAVRCIDNEILFYIRKATKDKKYVFASLEDPISNLKNDEIKLKDVIKSNYDIVKVYENKDIYYLIDQIVETLPERERDIIKLYFGFDDSERFTQQEIAEKFSISQATVCRIISRNLKLIGSLLRSSDLIDFSDKKGKQKRLNLE